MGMNMCVYIYIHTCIFSLHMHAYIHILYMCVYIYTCIDMCVYKCMYTSACVENVCMLRPRPFDEDVGTEADAEA